MRTSPVPGDDDLPRGWPPHFARSVEDRRALFVLSSLRGVTPRQLRRVAWELGTADACVRAIVRGEAGSDGDRDHVGRVDPDAIARAAEDGGARFLTWHDPEYPPAPTDLQHDPPAWLFVRGARLDGHDPRVAIVGARRCSALGREVAHDLGRRLGGAGITVVSGAALGIDAASHRGALDAGGRTIAVLGSGIDVAYPKGSAELIARIAGSGSIVSEYPPGTPPEPFRFPARNRIVAGLAEALVVVEGAAGSGSRISVDHALDLGRDVYAVPGPVTSPLSEVPLELIRDGATMIRGADDLLFDLGMTEHRPVAPVPPNLTDQERRVWDALADATLPDSVARTASLSIPDAVAGLIRLELRGLVRSVGGRYERTLVGTTGRPATGEREFGRSGDHQTTA